VTAVLLTLAIAVAVSPEDVPGLTLPDSPEAAQARDAMEMDMEMEMDDGGKSGAAMDER
jgi:hypothetical protein